MTTTNATAPAVTPDFERGVFYVTGSTSGTVYEAWLATSEAGTVRVACTCPAGRHARHGNPLPCKHARAVCELLEAHGLAVWDGQRWTATAKASVAA